jgi:hypothetical protein
VPPLPEISSRNVCVEEDDVMDNWTNQLNRWGNQIQVGRSKQGTTYTFVEGRNLSKLIIGFFLLKYVTNFSLSKCVTKCSLPNFIFN